MCSLIGWAVVVVMLCCRSAKPIPDELIAPVITTRATTRA